MKALVPTNVVSKNEVNTFSNKKVMSKVKVLCDRQADGQFNKRTKMVLDRSPEKGTLFWENITIYWSNKCDGLGGLQNVFTSLNYINR